MRNPVTTTLLPSNENMKKLILLNTLFFSIIIQAALPRCPSGTSLGWHDCFGALTSADGDEYLGEFKSGKYHGQGTLIFGNGKSFVGYFMMGEYIPNICKGMGLGKGTESFGNCVLKLIDEL